MRDDFDDAVVPLRRSTVSDEMKAEALFALGSFYVRQGYPKQGLSLLMIAQDFGMAAPAFLRALAHAYLHCGMPKQALAVLDALEDTAQLGGFESGATRLRARAMLALGRVDEARRIAFVGTRALPAPRRQGGAA